MKRRRNAELLPRLRSEIDPLGQRYAVIIPSGFLEHRLKRPFTVAEFKSRIGLETVSELGIRVMASLPNRATTKERLYVAIAATRFAAEIHCDRSPHLSSHL